MKQPSAIEPLEPAIWFRRLQKLSGKAAQIDGEAPDALIRQAVYLIDLAPGPLREVMPRTLDEPTLEQILACAGYETAVLGLIGPRTSYCAERRASTDCVEVTMTIEPLGTTGSGRHRNLAQAMLGAWIDCFINLEKAVDDLTLPRPSRRKFRSGRPPKSTEH